jgi:hypothetical protein
VPYGRCLRALAKCPGDGVGRRANVELGLEVREALPDGMKAQEQLPGDLVLVLHDGGRAQDLDFVRRQAKPIERGRPEARDLLLEQQRVRIAWQQAYGQAPAVPLADQRRARRK